ncbi:MAG: hypothetical protein ACXABJ_05810, partial [Candidatus Heimdallarchaeaceae archaeon]
MSHYFFNIWSIPYLVSFILLFTVVSIFLVKMYKDEKTLLYTVSLIFMTLASLAGFLATNSEEVEIWNTWVMLIFFFGLTSMASFCHYSFLYNDERKIIERKFLFLFYLIPLAFLTIFLVDKTIF